MSDFVAAFPAASAPAPEHPVAEEQAVKRVTAWLCACIHDRAEYMLVYAPSDGKLNDHEIEVLAKALSILADDSNGATCSLVYRAEGLVSTEVSS